MTRAQGISTRVAPLVVALLFAALPIGAVPAQTGELLELSTFPRSVLTIEHGAQRHQFNVWLADTAERQMQGLMFVRDLPADQGMLFVNREPRVVSMWMKNTFIPLDMLFIDARGRIVKIFERTVPQSLDTLSAPKPVKAVLELRGGEAARRGIRAGDRVRHAAFTGSGRSADTTAGAR